jgi:hypothetical protein
MFDDNDKDLSRGFDGNQENPTLPLISNDLNKKNLINTDSIFSASNEPLYEMTNDEEPTKITTTAVPGTPAARATN